MGECVQLKECDFVRSFGDILNSEILQELRDRNSACGSHGRRLICCEKSAGSSVVSDQQLALTPMTHYAAPTVVQAPTDPTPFRFQGESVDHPNFNVFKNLKCGSSYSNRVANGIYQRCFFHTKT